MSDKAVKAPAGATTPAKSTVASPAVEKQAAAKAEPVTEVIPLDATDKTKPAGTATVAAAKRPAPSKAGVKAPVKPVAAKSAVAKPVVEKAVKAAKAAKADTAAPAELAVKKGKKKSEKAEKEEKPAKVKKTKLVRDSYAMPEPEYQQIGALKKRFAGLGGDIKKSELLRAGIALLVSLDDAGLKAAVSRVERIKTGRPAK